MTSTPGACLPGYASHFGLNNIPFGIASSDLHPNPQSVTRFEDNVIFLADIEALQEIKDLPPNTLSQPTLNDLAALPRSIHQEIRTHLQTLLKSSSLPSKGDSLVVCHSFPASTTQLPPAPHPSGLRAKSHPANGG